MGETVLVLWRLGMMILGGAAAWKWGLPVGTATVAPMLAPYTGHMPLLFWVLGGLLIFLPVFWIGNSIGATLTRGLQAKGTSPVYKIGQLGLLLFALWAGYEGRESMGRMTADLTAPLTRGDRNLQQFAGGAILALALFAFGQVWAYFLARDAEGNTDKVTRRIVGWFWRGLIWLLAMVFVIVSILAIVNRTGHTDDLEAIRNGPFGWNAIILGVVGMVALHYVNRWTKVGIAHASGPVRHAWREWSAGHGGSATFAGLFEEWASQWKRGDILLGASLYEPDWRVGNKDDRHILTIAGTGGGKGRSLIIPNLLQWPGSALVIDPKGTNAAVTGARRGSGGGSVSKSQGLGQKVYCINPFGLHKDRPGMPPAARFNPLSFIDPGKAKNYEDIEMIAEAMVIPDAKDPHWTESAKALIAGTIDFVTKTIKGAHLGHVRDTIVHPDGLPFEQMISAGGIAKDAASQLLAAGDKERGSIMSTAIRQTAWLSDQSVLRDCLCASDFDLMDLKREPCTIYLVLPLEMIATHARFLRVFINLAIMAASRGPRGKHDILFVMDEFYSLGRVDKIATAASNIRSYGVRLWPIVQNLGQIGELYEENWQGFVANAGVTQFFSTNDAQTFNWVAERLGGHAVAIKDIDGNIAGQSIAFLRTGEEITRATGRKSGNIVVIREGSDPFMLRRIEYDSAMRGLFNQDPDHAR